MINDHKRLTKWVDEYSDELYKWAYYKTSSRETAEDLVQETFVVAAEKPESFKGNSSPKTWLFSILNHKIVDVYRRKIRTPVSIENEGFSTFFSDNGDWQSSRHPKEWNEDESNLLDDKEFQQVLKNCLEQLPTKWHLCVKLKYLTQKSGEEICQDLEITTTNYWQILHRAKLQLRECVEHNWFNSK